MLILRKKQNTDWTSGLVSLSGYLPCHGADNANKVKSFGKRNVLRGSAKFKNNFL